MLLQMAKLSRARHIETFEFCHQYLNSHFRLSAVPAQAGANGNPGFLSRYGFRLLPE